MQRLQERTQQTRQQEGTKQQGEHFAQDKEEGPDETESFVGLYQGEEQGNGYGCQDVGQEGVGGQAGSTASQFIGDDGCRNPSPTDS